MTLKEIVREYLKEHGYDGLFSEADCACLADDLFPCDSPRDDCQPGHRLPCDCGDHDFHIGVKEEEEKKCSS